MIPGLFAKTELPSPSYRTVLVKGVEVEMFEDWKPSSIDPMKVSLSWYAEDPQAGFTAEQITKLHLAGVEHLPIYETEADRRGLKWEEIE